MKFYIPNAEDEEQAMQIYDGIRKFLSEQLGADFSNRRVFRLCYRHEGKDYEAEVGRRISLNGELVIAILYEDLRRLYHVCTPNRGVLRGISILVGVNEVVEAQDFE